MPDLRPDGSLCSIFLFHESLNKYLLTRSMLHEFASRIHW
jgi:hypothetical protein